jgi:hypothetical protein
VLYVVIVSAFMRNVMGLNVAAPEVLRYKMKWTEIKFIDLSKGREKLTMTNYFLAGSHTKISNYIGSVKKILKILFFSKHFCAQGCKVSWAVNKTVSDALKIFPQS